MVDKKIRLTRKHNTSEDFTPEFLVNEMLDLLPEDFFEDPQKIFIDPCSGNGNFLIVILQRKLKRGASSFTSIIHIIWGRAYGR